MLEIKGKRGQIGVEDVRQLTGWMQSAIADEEDWHGKGILGGERQARRAPT
jgi:hypothetical protein